MQHIIISCKYLWPPLFDRQFSPSCYLHRHFMPLVSNSQTTFWESGTMPIHALCRPPGKGGGGMIITLHNYRHCIRKGMQYSQDNMQYVKSIVSFCFSKITDVTRVPFPLDVPCSGKYSKYMQVFFIQSFTQHPSLQVGSCWVIQGVHRVQLSPSSFPFSGGFCTSHA